MQDTSDDKTRFVRVHGQKKIAVLLATARIQMS